MFPRYCRPESEAHERLYEQGPWRTWKQSAYACCSGPYNIPNHQQIRNVSIVIAHVDILALYSYAHDNDIGANGNRGYSRGVDQRDD